MKDWDLVHIIPQKGNIYIFLKNLSGNWFSQYMARFRMVYRNIESHQKLIMTGITNQGR